MLDYAVCQSIKMKREVGRNIQVGCCHAQFPSSASVLVHLQSRESNSESCNENREIDNDKTYKSLWSNVRVLCQVVDDVSILIPGSRDGGSRVANQSHAAFMETERRDILVVLVNTLELISQSLNDLKRTYIMGYESRRFETRVPL